MNEAIIFYWSGLRKGYIASVQFHSVNRTRAKNWFIMRKNHASGVSSHFEVLECWEPWRLNSQLQIDLWNTLLYAIATITTIDWLNGFYNLLSLLSIELGLMMTFSKCVISIYFQFDAVNSYCFYTISFSLFFFIYNFRPF